MDATADTVGDFESVRDALIVLSGHLPHFSDDPRKRARAEQHLRLRDEAFDALDRIADQASTPHMERRTNAA